MAERIVQEESLTLVADAIRAKGGTTDALSFPTGFAYAISAIQAGGGGAQYGVMWDEPSFPKEATLLTARTYVPSYLCYSSGSTGAYYYIEKFNMPNTITEIENYAFYGCFYLKNIDISNVTAIGNYAFYKCIGLSLSTFDMSNVTTIGQYAFASNQGRVFSGTLSLPLVESIGNYAFQQSGISVADLPLVTSLGASVFSNCASLTTVNAPLATSLGTYVFSNCTSLTTVNVPLATSLGSRSFENCTSLTALDVPLIKKIDGYAFRGSTSFKTLILRNETMATLSNTNAFSNTPIASGTGYIYVPAALVDSYKAASNWSTYANQFRALEDYTVDGTITGALDESQIVGV